MIKKIFSYKSPVNLNYYWNFGSLLIYLLLLQILTGFLLTIWYVPSTSQAFFSINVLMREVNSGWFLRYLHANGASFFFLLLYSHISRGFFYRSYNNNKRWVWLTGSIIFILTMGVAFLGYVLPWGQMSYWAATVISSFVTVIPYIGKSILTFLSGGLNLDQPSLSRIYSLHFILPFIITSLVVMHIFYLHDKGSTNPSGLKSRDFVSIFPYFSTKDLLGVCFVNIGISLIVFFYPNVLGHTDNYIEANSNITPLHIVPEWYFLPYYGILRSVPYKEGGVFLLLVSLVLLILLPWLNDEGSTKLLIHRFSFKQDLTIWILIVNFIVLGWAASKPVIAPFLEVCRLSTVCYFFIITGLVPGLLYSFKDMPYIFIVKMVNMYLKRGVVLRDLQRWKNFEYIKHMKSGKSLKHPRDDTRKTSFGVFSAERKKNV